MGENEERIGKLFRELLPLYEHIDLSVECASAGVFRCRVPLNEANSNHFDTVHAALQFAAAEMLGGLVAESLGLLGGQYLGVVRKFEIEFKTPATTDITAEAHVSDDELSAVVDRLNASGRVDFDVDSTVTDEQGTVVATARGTYAIRPALRS